MNNAMERAATTDSSNYYKKGVGWCLGRAAVCDCGSPLTFFLPFFLLFFVRCVGGGGGCVIISILLFATFKISILLAPDRFPRYKSCTNTKHLVRLAYGITNKWSSSCEKFCFPFILCKYLLMACLGSFSWELYANGFLCISVLRVASGPRVKLAGCKSALNPPGGLFYWPF